MNRFPNNNHKILASSLFDLCSKKSTGSLFIMTTRNTSAEFILKDGVILELSFEKNRGSDAINLFKETAFNKFQFIKNYHFPLPSDAKVRCSNTVLSRLGYDVYLTGLKIETTNDHSSLNSNRVSA